MKSAARIESDRQRKAQRSRTNQSEAQRTAATGGGAHIPMDDYVTWVGNVPTVMKVFRFGQVGGRGFGQGGFA